ncbi:hypothetical protein FOZ61_003778 [Perkinsus olseni]|uniref:Uncharacterized protein n=2 Tax=Perkinsus olseni TaxID=32597 RepID=A0A7J6MTT5_PEROL|nr:hypothetical protein FOZ61_003778 [Perkinsus olseni]KAF4675008.1 hypothetical protein FOL46_003176 [Perkinsus olseni]
MASSSGESRLEKANKKSPFVQIMQLAIPNMISFLVMYSIFVITIFFVSATNDSNMLGAIGLGSVIQNVFGFSIGVGLMSVLDTLVSQAVGAGNPHLGLIYFNRARIVGTIAFVPCFIVMFYTEPILLWMNQDPLTSKLAADYVRGMNWGLWPFFMYNAMCSFLRSHRLPEAPLYVNAITGCGHALFCWLFLFKFHFGAYGVGIAMTCTQWGRFILLELYAALWHPETHAHGWTPESLHNLWEFVALAIPSALLMWSEWWAYEVQSVFAGWVGPMSLAAHVAASNIVSIIYMGPCGISQSASALVGNALGGGDVRTAHLFNRKIIRGTLACFILVAILMCNFRYYVAYLYSRDPAVLSILCPALLAVSVFCIFDAMQACQEGVLRGCALQGRASTYKLLAMLLIRLPLGYVFAFGWGVIPAMGVPGIWWASVVGMAITCTAYGLIIYRCDFDKCAQAALDRREKEEKLKAASSPLLKEEEAAGAGAAV